MEATGTEATGTRSLRTVHRRVVAAPCALVRVAAVTLALLVSTGGSAGAQQATSSSVVVVERDAARVVLVEPDGPVRELAGGLAGPRGVAAAPDGRAVFVVEGAGGRLLRVPVVGDGAEEVVVQGMNGPEDVAVLDDGTLLVSTFGDGRVLRFPPDGEPEEVAIGLDGPTGLAVVDSGPAGEPAVLVGEFRTGSVLAVPLDAEALPRRAARAVATGLAEPEFLAVAPDGRVFVADSSGSVHEVDPAGARGPRLVAEVEGALGIDALGDADRYALMVTAGDRLVRVDPTSGLVEVVEAVPAGAGVATLPRAGPVTPGGDQTEDAAGGGSDLPVWVVPALVVLGAVLVVGVALLVFGGRETESAVPSATRPGGRAHDGPARAGGAAAALRATDRDVGRRLEDEWAPAPARMGGGRGESGATTARATTARATTARATTARATTGPPASPVSAGPLAVGAAPSEPAPPEPVAAEPVAAEPVSEPAVLQPGASEPVGGVPASGEALADELANAVAVASTARLEAVAAAERAAAAERRRRDLEAVSRATELVDAAERDYDSARTAADEERIRLAERRLTASRALLDEASAAGVPGGVDATALESAAAEAVRLRTAAEGAAARADGAEAALAQVAARLHATRAAGTEAGTEGGGPGGMSDATAQLRTFAVPDGPVELAVHPDVGHGAATPPADLLETLRALAADVAPARAEALGRWSTGGSGWIVDPADAVLALEATAATLVAAVQGGPASRGRFPGAADVRVRIPRVRVVASCRCGDTEAGAADTESGYHAGGAPCVYEEDRTDAGPWFLHRGSVGQAEVAQAAGQAAQVLRELLADDEARAVHAAACSQRGAPPA